MTEETEKKAGRPKNVDIVVGNRSIGTSKGKVKKGETVSLPPKEAEEWVKAGFAKNA